MDATFPWFPTSEGIAKCIKAKAEITRLPTTTMSRLRANLEARSSFC